MKVNTDILTMATADLADNQEDQGEINYDPTKLPGTRRSHPPVKVLHADLIKGQAAKSEMEKALRITVAMIINELTGPGVSASKLRLDDYWVYDQFATHSLTASNDTHALLDASIRSRSGKLEFNVFANIRGEGDIEIFAPCYSLPFETKTVNNSPSFEVFRNGSVSVEKTYRTHWSYQVNDPMTGESTRDQIEIYFGPGAPMPADSPMEFRPLGQRLGIVTVHDDAPEASGEGTSVPRASRRTRKVEESSEAAADAPVSLE